MTKLDIAQGEVSQGTNIIDTFSVLTLNLFLNIECSREYFNRLFISFNFIESFSKIGQKIGMEEFLSYISLNLLVFVVAFVFLSIAA